MRELLGPVLVVVVTMVIVALLSRLIGRSRPAVIDARQGTIRPEFWSALLTVGLGTAIFLAAVWGIFVGGGRVAVAAALVGAAIAGFMAPSLTSMHAVCWSERGIEGPTKIFGPTLGLSRTEIAWADIVTTGKTATGYWYVQSADGRRVYWSYLYKGYGALIAALQRRCPTLNLCL
jgi:hypothetical protein